MKKVNSFCMFVLFLFVIHLGCAQEKKASPIDFSLRLESTHLWRGIEVSDEPTIAAETGIKDRGNIFNFGIWSGTSITAKFKEFDYFASFSKSGFTASVWDIYNFSPGANYNNRELFNYHADETGHFIDVTAQYRFAGKYPLQVSWSTILFGRDRGELNNKNRYSTYIALDYPVLQNAVVNLDLGIGGAFALNRVHDTTGYLSAAHFYGNTPGIVNLNFTVSKDFTIGSYRLPVSAMCMWNPEKSFANVQISMNIF